MSLRICSLASGSSGNCYLVRTEDTVLLVDAGISGKQIALRLEAMGLAISDVDGVLITHEHSDHVKGLPALIKQNRRIYASRGTLDAFMQEASKKKACKSDKTKAAKAPAGQSGAERQNYSEGRGSSEGQGSLEGRGSSEGQGNPEGQGRSEGQGNPDRQGSLDEQGNPEGQCRSDGQGNPEGQGRSEGQGSLEGQGNPEGQGRSEGQGNPDRQGNQEGFEYLQAGESYCIGDIEIKTFHTSHDAAEPIGYSLTACGRCISVVTDTGYVSDEVKSYMAAADILVLESNHDVNVLKVGPYPWFLKQRILSDKGHLSNEAAATALAEIIAGENSERTRLVLLAHLSKENNFPEMARATMENILREKGCMPKACILRVLSRNEVSEIYE